MATAVVHPCDETSLKGALEAAEEGLIRPILVGPQDKIRNVAKTHSLDLGRVEIVDVPHSQAAAEKAVELIRAGKAELLMKGSLHTDELLSAVVRRDTGIRLDGASATSSSWTFPSHPHTLFITDAAMNIAPDLAGKRDIIQNAIDLHVGLGLGTPKVAILSAVETVTPRIPSTIDAAALCKMADRGQITGGVLDGPLAFDNAISPEAARIKGIMSPVAGQAQILVVPDLEAGNMLAKNLTFLSHADAAGIVLGARVPIILTSRADNIRTRHGILRGRDAAPPQPDIQAAAFGPSVMTETILVVNAGSSSIKFQLFLVTARDRLERRLKGQFEGIGVKPHLIARRCRGRNLDRRDVDLRRRSTACPRRSTGWLHFSVPGSGSFPTAIGHRVVHGGPDYSEPIVVDETLLERLEHWSPLAPLHQPNNLAPIRAMRERQPQHAAGRLLRHGVSSRPSRGRRPLRDSRAAL